MTDLTAVQHPIADLPITAKISIPGSPDWVGIGPNAVWISNAGRNSLARIDPAKNTVAKTVPVGRRPCSGLAIGFSAVLAPSFEDTSVTRLQPLSNKLLTHTPT